MKLYCLGLVVAFTAVKLAESRNPKKGMAMLRAQTCGALESHTDLSWWYSWSHRDGYYNSFCEQPQTAVDNARADGLEFVPMFWGGIPQQPFDNNTVANLQAETYLMAFNEPEISGQADMDPTTAAQIWPSFLAVAQEYNLEVVGPCVTDGEGQAWYASWTSACKSLYSDEPCYTDYTCLHMYYHPYPCPTSEVKDWSCVRAGASEISNKINIWYNTYQKPIWVTEFACPSWGWADDQIRPCSEAEQIALMEQVVPVFESTPEVFRYAWYTAYDTSWLWNALNEKAWTQDLPRGYGCVGKKWVAGFGDAGWQIQAMHECVAAADNDPECYTPLALSVDDANCYCARQNCTADCNIDASENCTQVEYNHEYLTTYFEQFGLRETNALTTVGTLYNGLSSPPTSTPTTASPPPTTSPVMATPSPTGSPTSSPITPPTKSPTIAPTFPPTVAPTGTPCGQDGAGCAEDTDCCSNQCDNNGKPASRTYTCIGGPSPPTTPSSPPPSTSPGTCANIGEACSDNSNCCSNNCDNKGKASDRTYLCLA